MAYRLGYAIMRARKARGWSAAELAKRLGMNSPAEIYKWESGKHHPEGRNLVALANTLRVDFSLFAEPPAVPPAPEPPPYPIEQYLLPLDEAAEIGRAEGIHRAKSRGRKAP